MFSPSMFGDDIAKPTRIRDWETQLPSMQPVCAWYPSRGAFSCGQTKAKPHVHLSTNKPGDRRMCTWKAASYPPGTVKAWAKDIAARSQEMRETKHKQVLTDTEKEALDLLFDDEGGVKAQVHQPTRSETVRCAPIGAPLCSGTGAEGED